MKRLYGATPAREFGPRSLKSLRQQLLDSGLCRNTINRRISRIKTMFKWAESEELVPASTYHALQSVRGLAKGRSAARETAGIRPVAAEIVAATLPFLTPMTRHMVCLQQLTGMRSGELVKMRAIDLDTSGNVWQYRPGSDQGPEGEHKTAHLGHTRVIFLGPKAIEIVKRRLVPNVTEFLFSPAKGQAKWNAERRLNRKSKVQPSQLNRRKKSRKRSPGDRYTTGTYRQAIERACEKAGVSPWFPHQLRHTNATEIRKQFGLDGASAVLGHNSLTITQTYAELDMNQTTEIMEKIG